MIRYSKVGGLRFIRIGSLQLSFCVTRQPSKLPVVSDDLDGVLATLMCAAAFVLITL